MDKGISMLRRTLLLAAATLLASLELASAQTTPKRIRGTIQALDGNTLTVQTNSGDTIRVQLAANYGVTAIVPATLDAVKPGAKIAIVGFGPPKQQRAAVISIFPPGSTLNELQIPWTSAPDS